MDFGVAHVDAASMTGTGNVMGTADYMSPEQVQGKKVDGRSDLFSVGCMLFELAAGRRPFHADNLMAIFYKITHEGANFDLIPQGAEYDALMPILKKALATDIAGRYQTAYEFAVDLREWLKTHASSASSQNAFEALVDLEAPTHAPMPMTEAPGVLSEGGATVDLGRRGPRRSTLVPTRAGGRTVVDGVSATMRSGATRVVTAPPVRVPARPARAPAASVLPWVAMALALVAVGVAGYLAWKSQQAPATPPVTMAVATPAPPPPTTVATPAPPPVTAAPAPAPVEASGRAAGSIRAAQAALDRGDFDRALAEAGKALGEDPGNRNAQQLQDRARAGQRALAGVRAGEAALARGDFAAAELAAAEARAAAPWSEAAVDLQRRVEAARREAQAGAQSQRATQVNASLNQAATALQSKRYEAAIAAYEQALQLDPTNAAAIQGRQAAIGAKSIADASASGPRPGGGRSFVAGRTEAKGTEQGGLVGFEDSAGVEVKKGTQAAELPGKIVFEPSPVSPTPGEGYRLSVFLSNEGSQPIQLASMTVATTVDGRPRRGRAPGHRHRRAPSASASLPDAAAEVWKEGTTPGRWRSCSAPRRRHVPQYPHLEVARPTS